MGKSMEQRRMDRDNSGLREMATALQSAVAKVGQDRFGQWQYYSGYAFLNVRWGGFGATLTVMPKVENGRRYYDTWVDRMGISIHDYPKKGEYDTPEEALGGILTYFTDRAYGLDTAKENAALGKVYKEAIKRIVPDRYEEILEAMVAVTAEMVKE